MSRTPVMKATWRCPTCGRHTGTALDPKYVQTPVCGHKGTPHDAKRTTLMLLTD